MDDKNTLDKMDLLIESLRNEEKNIGATAVVAAAMFVKSIGLTALVALPAFVLINITTTLALPEEAAGTGFTAALLNPSENAWVVNYALFNLFVTALFSPIPTAAAIAAVKCYLNKETPDIMKILDGSVFIWARIAVTNVMFIILASISLIFIIPALFVYVFLQFYLCAAVMDERWGTGAFAASYAAVKGRFLKSLGRAALLAVSSFFATVFYSAIFGVFTVVFPFLGGLIPTAIIIAAGQTICLFTVYFTAVWYFNYSNTANKEKNE